MNGKPAPYSREQMYTKISRIAELHAQLALTPNEPKVLAELLLELGLAHIEQLPERSGVDALALSQIIVGANLLLSRLAKMENRVRALNDITDEWCSDEVSCMYSCAWHDREDAAALQVFLSQVADRPGILSEAGGCELATIIASIDARLVEIDTLLRVHSRELEPLRSLSRVSQLVWSKLQ